MRGGRPRAAEPRVTQVTVRLSARERAAILKQAGGAGKLSAYLRAAGLGQPRQPVVPPVNWTAWEALARTAANLNQITHHANSGLVTDGAQVVVVVAELREQVAALRLALIGAHAAPRGGGK